MRVSFSVLFAIFLSLDAFAAPFPNADVGNESALEVRTAKLAARKPVKQVAPKKVAKAKAPIKAAPKKKVPAKAPAKVAPKKVPTKAPAKVVPKKKVPAKAPVKVVPKKKGVPAKVPAKGKTTPVKGSPKTPTKATTGTKAPIKVPAKAPTKSAAKPSASAKPSNKPLCNAKQVEARAIEARARVRHPSATGTITLFHGANPVNAAKLANSKVNLAIGAPVGDFNHRPEVPGGFYLTDSLVAAAQFACFGIPRQRPAKVDVLQFKWTGAGVAVHEFPGETAEWNNFQLYNSNPNLVINAKSPFRALAQEIYQNAMITGPLNGAVDNLITNNFQQYAVVDQDVADSNLRLEQHFKNIICANVPTGNELTAGLYAQGQAGNAKFNTRLVKLQDPNFRPGEGLCVIQ